VLGIALDAGRHLFHHHAVAGGHQVAYHRFDVTADVADLGVLGGLDLDERSAA
jgi:hypothetical protein